MPLTPVILHYVFSTQVTGTVSEAIVFIAVWFIPATLLIIITKRCRVVTSPDGIESFDPELMIHLRTSWDNIERIVYLRGSPVLVLHDPILPKNKVLAKATSKFGFGKSISLKHYAWQWHNGGLEQDLKAYAPHLFRDTQ